MLTPCLFLLYTTFTNMKYTLLILLLSSALGAAAQDSFFVRKNYISIEGMFEEGIKGYQGVNIKKAYSNDYVRPGGGFGYGVTGGRIISKTWLLKLGLYLQSAPQEALAAPHDTTARFAKFNIIPALRYYIPVKKKTNTRGYVELGAVAGLMAKMKENAGAYSAVVTYKPTIGAVIQTGLDIFCSSRLSIDLGIRFHYMNYSAKSYTLNGSAAGINQLPAGLESIKGSGGGVFISMKYWF